MRRPALSVTSPVAVCLALGFASGCLGAERHAPSDGSVTDGGAEGGSGGTGGGTPSPTCGDTGPVSGCVPPLPTGAPAGDGTGSTVLAMSRLFLGDTDRSGHADPDAWKAIGFNLDSRISNAKSTDVCKPVAGANPALVKTDGTHGIDNSFGENIMPIFVGLTSDAAPKVDDPIHRGIFTNILKIDALGTGQDYAGLAASLYGGGNLSKVAGYENGPKWDGQDPWPVLHESVVNGDENSPKVEFPSSYVASRTWVSGSVTDATLFIPIMDYPCRLTIHHATISMDLGADDTSATNGTIGGVLSSTELNEGLKAVAGRISPSLCQGSTLDSLLQQITAASDIMSDATQDPAKTCDGISVGLGFDSKAVKLGDVTQPAQPGEDPCAAP